MGVRTLDGIADHTVITNNIYLAALVVHVGHELLGVESDRQNRFHFVCPPNELDSLKAEMEAPDSTLVDIGNFVRSIQTLFGYIQTARKENGAVWFGTLAGHTVITSSR